MVLYELTQSLWHFPVTDQDAVNSEHLVMRSANINPWKQALFFGRGKFSARKPGTQCVIAEAMWGMYSLIYKSVWYSCPQVVCVSTNTGES